MTPDGAFDRRLTTWLEEDAAPRAPQGFDDVVAESVNQMRQLPSWATTERWISMETRAQLGVMPRVVIALLTIAVLAIGAIGGFLIAGNLVNAEDGGDVAPVLTYASPPGVVYAHPTDGTGGPVPLTPDDEFVFNFAWSPDGTRFAYDSRTDPRGPATITIRDADGSNPVVVSEPFEEPTSGNFVPRRIVWSPDGTRVIHWARGLDVDEVQPWPCGLDGTFCGQRIWSAASDGSELARVIGDPALDARSPVWTPDGESIVFTGSAAGSGSDYGLYRMDADGVNVERIGDLSGSAFALDYHSISPDGKTAVVVSGDEQYDLYLVDLATGEHVLIAGGEGEASEPYWSPDGSLIAFSIWPNNPSGPQAMLYDVVSEEVLSLDMTLYAQGWSRDGRSILAGWPEGTVTVVDVTDPMAPVATEIEGLTEAFRATWQPLP